jgi:hypothetical protein
MKLNINISKLIGICKLISISIVLFFIYTNCEYNFQLGFHFSLYLPPVQAFIVAWFLLDAFGLSWLYKRNQTRVIQFLKHNYNENNAENMV